MQRASGRPVSEVLAESLDRGNEPDESLLDIAGRVLQALAHYHEWRGTAPPSGRASTLQRESERTIKQLKELRCAVPDAQVERLALQLWERVSDVPLVGKRDAHAENWLIPARSSQRWVALVDLETRAWTPMVFEVAQFLEDFPLLPVTDGGWQQRLNLAHTYLDWLPVRLGGASLSDPDRLREVYESFALTRAIFLLRHLAGSAEPGLSTGSPRMRRARLAHADALVTMLMSSIYPHVADLAAVVAARRRA